MTNLPGQTKDGTPEPFVFEKFGSLNTREKRPAIKDSDFSWIENWMPIADGNMRTLWDAGPDVYTAPTGLTIIHYYAYNIGDVAYFAIFLSDGSAVQFQISNQAQIAIGGPGTFWNSTLTSLPVATQFESKYLVIASTLTANSYWIWNGSALFTAGTLSPDITVTDGGSGYTSAPTITVTGGSGSGAMLTATVSNGAVTEITVNNPGSGYSLNDQPQLSFTGGGSDTSAAATATVTTTSGGVSQVLVTSGGTGYNNSTVVGFSGGGGSGASAVVSGATNGVLTAITVTNPGQGYTSAPTASLTAGGGTGAVLLVDIQQGQVTGITITNNGTGYHGAPNVVISAPDALGGATLQATAIAQVGGGGVFAITVTNPGYGYTKASVQLVGGNNSASATATLMPFGMSGDTLETYQDRVWLANGTTLSETGAETTSDFSTDTGGGSSKATDSFLRRKIFRLIQTNGYLYRFGDSSINVISNVNTSGVPATTTYSNSNVDPQMGTAWRESVVSFGRALVFANPSGVYALYGAAAEKVSDNLDGIFEKASFNTGQSGLTPTAAVATVFGRRVYILTLTATDSFTNTLRNLMCVWDGQRWFIGTQTKQVTYLQTQEFDSAITAYGSDGTNLFEVFVAPNAALPKYYQTKLRAQPSYIDYKSSWRFWMLGNNNGTDAATITVQVDQFGGQPSSSPAPALVFNEVQGPFVDQLGTSVFGRLIGETVTVQASDLSMISNSLLTESYSSKA